MGVTAAIVFTNLGAAYGTAKSGVGICSMGVMHPGLIMKCKHSLPTQQGAAPAAPRPESCASRAHAVRHRIE